MFAERKFFLEAKKPCVNIDKVDAPARQARRHGYTANLKTSVLSNFEYLMIFDASEKVKETDTYQTARIKKYHYTEYEENFEELQCLLGKESYKDLLAIADGDEKKKSANKSIYLPKNLDNWNKYITFAA